MVQVAYDPNIPIFTPNAGTEAAYRDPNSPESLMKKTVQTDVQSKKDRKYDVQAFLNYEKRLSPVTILYYFFIPLLLITLLIQKTKESKLFLLSLCVILLVISIYFTQNGRC